MTSARPFIDEGIKALGERDARAAAAAFEKAVHADPVDTDARFRLAGAYHELCRHGDAENELRRVIADAPAHARAHTTLGLILLETGRPKESVAAHEAAMAADPHYATAVTNWLSAQQYVPGVSSASLGRSHARWAELVMPGAARVEQPVRRPLAGRPLVAGFVSPDLGRHPVGLLSVRMFENLDHRLVRPVVFSTKPAEYEDDISRRIAQVTRWNAVYGLSDSSLASFIRASKVDLLIDMSGHTGYNRLRLFAARAAPVQASWLGYTGTTGVSAMDYLIAAPALAPTGEEAFLSERLARLPHAHFCYEPIYAPAVGPAPSTANGYVTFGSFNNPAKLNQVVLKSYAAIMRASPGSRLKLRYRGLGEPANAARLHSAFGALGIRAERIDLAGEVDRETYLAGYSEIDLALDTFPFSGCMTTCDALWMGCPVVTFPGESIAARLSAAILSSIGLNDLIAPDNVGYEALAIRLAHDPARRAALRAELRSRMTHSSLCDGPRFARDFADTLHSIWNEPTGSAPSHRI